MTPDPKQPPKYRQVSDELRRRIRALEILPGQHLPTEMELAAEFGCSRPTIRQAIDTLVNEGLLISGKGRGIQVRPTVFVTELLDSAYRRALEAAQGRTPPSESIPGSDIKAAWVGERVEADEDLAELFHLEQGTPLWRRNATATMFGQPRWIITSYLPWDLVDGTAFLNPDLTWSGRREEIAAELWAFLGLEFTQVDEVWQAVLPSADQVDKLRIVGRSALLTLTRQVFVGGRVVEVARSIDYDGSQAAVRHRIRP